MYHMKKKKVQLQQLKIIIGIISYLLEVVTHLILFIGTYLTTIVINYLQFTQIIKVHRNFMKMMINIFLLCKLITKLILLAKKLGVLREILKSIN